MFRFTATATRMAEIEQQCAQRIQAFQTKVVPYFKEKLSSTSLNLTLNQPPNAWFIQIIFNDASEETCKYFNGVSIAWPLSFPITNNDTSSLEMALIKKSDSEFRYTRFLSMETNEFVNGDIGINYYGNPNDTKDLNELWEAVTKLQQIAKTQTAPYTPGRDYDSSSDSDNSDSEESASAATPAFRP